MGFDRPVLLEGEISPHKSIIELSRLDLQRLHIAGDLLLTSEVHDLEGAGSVPILRATNNDAQMWFDRMRNRLW